MPVPEGLQQCNLHIWRRLLFTHALGGSFGCLRKHTRFGHPLCAIAAMGRMFERCLAQSHIEQLHPHKLMHNFIEFPACHAIHVLPPERAPSALAPKRFGRSFSSNMDRARFSLDLTVPTGHASNVDASM